MEITDNQKEKILRLLKESSLTAYYIASKTGITEQSIINYRKGKSKMTDANAKLLEYFFADENVNKGKKHEKKSENTASDCSANVIQSPNAITTINAAAMDEIVRNNEFLRDEIRRMHDLIASIVNLKSNGNE